jgi:translation initiation factor 1
MTKGKKGNGVSVITGLALDEYDLKELARTLKQKCGVGGTTKNGVIEIQTDKRDLIVTELKKAGFDAKIAGG